MKTKIVRVKDRGTALKYYLVTEFGRSYKDSFNDWNEPEEMVMMESLGWGRRYRQYPYLIVELIEGGGVSAVISHFDYPQYDIGERSKKMECHGTNLFAVTIISEFKFDDLPEMITEKEMERRRDQFIESEKGFNKEHTEKLTRKEE